MNQKFYYSNDNLALFLLAFLVLLFAVEYVFLTTLIALITVIPLLGMLLFLKSKYVYVIHNDGLDIYHNNNKTILLAFDEIQSINKIEGFLKREKVSINLKNNQNFIIHLKREDIDKFISILRIQSDISPTK